jgi:hypothetical protein
VNTDQRPDRVQIAVVRDGRPNWAAAEVAIAGPTAAAIGEHPHLATLFAALVTAPTAPSYDWVRVAGLDRVGNRIDLEVDSRPALLAWSEFLGLTDRSEVLERKPDWLNVLRSGRVTVAGVRLRVAVRWALRLIEVGS